MPTGTPPPPSRATKQNKKIGKALKCLIKPDLTKASMQIGENTHCVLVSIKPIKQ